MEGFVSHTEQSSLPRVTLPQLSCLRPAFSPHSTRHPNLFVSLLSVLRSFYYSKKLFLMRKHPETEAQRRAQHSAPAPRPPQNGAALPSPLLIALSAHAHW